MVRVLVLGADPRGVADALRPLQLDVVSEEGLRPATDVDSRDAVVLIPPLRGAPCQRALGSLRDARPELPVFVVVRQGAPDREVVRLYRRGAAAVFAWPLERKLLPAALADLLGIGYRPSRAREADRALERAIRARLRVLGKADAVLRISVRNGIARLAGQVDRLWKVRSLEANVAHIPGVLATDTRRLEVEPASLPDSAIARSVRGLLQGVSSVEDRTLSVSVCDGHVVLMGTAVNREEWLHALEVLAMLEGVRSVTNKTVAAPRRKRAERALASRLEERLSALVPGSEEIRVAVLGGVAVLRGRVRLLAVRREAEAVLARDPSVARVVSKLEIVPE